MTDQFTAKATYGQVFAVTQFRVIFAGRLLGVMSDTLRSVALAVLVFRQTASPLLTAMAFTIGFLPQAAGGLFLAAMADRFSPRTLIATGYALQCAVGLLLAFGHLPVVASLLLVAAVACLTPVTTGAAGRVMAEVLTGDTYVLGRSLSYLVAVAAQMVGMAAGGVLVGWLGVERTMLVTAGAHLLASVISRLFLSRTEVVRQGGSIVRRTFQGNAALVAAPGVTKLIMVQCLPAAYLAAAGSLLIPYAAQRAFDPRETGILLAATSVGMLIGDVVVGRAFAPATRERLVLPLLLVMGTPPIALVLDLPYPAVAAAYVITGVGSAYLLGLQRRFLEAVPADLQGQGFALLNTTTMTIQGIGPLVFGVFAEFLPVGLAIALTGVSSVLTTLLLRNAIRPRTSG
ncbi:MFS transporter [Actinophytocola algeriensis]|uniref:MFS family permease n=1 Tax=Actinophytocola algeriensis TaxID=1768010 RepID=A0A7W7Q2Z3_9PSEU|nr:MFS transporter [Actinophytocola algeriensis]MBB4905977.1 MFS family permease [Actinophytocola algeriensis]MBE1472338.1 MFS family permease [Actinophytocola algeriensis]